MTDIELDDLGDRRDQDDIVIVEAVTGMHFESGFRSCARGGDKPRKLAVARETALGSGGAISAGMKLDGISPNFPRSFDLLEIGIDEKRDLDATAPERGDERRERSGLARDVEPAFGRDLLPPLGHETTSVRGRRERDREHLLR